MVGIATSFPMQCHWEYASMIVAQNECVHVCTPSALCCYMLQVMALPMNGLCSVSVDDECWWWELMM